MKQTAIVIASLLAISTVPASAQNARSFVSGLGSDSNACSRTAACRTFQHAHDVTNAGGEIDVLDPAGYGAIVITKAISIVNDGVGTSSVLVPSGNMGIGITINAGANDAISLRGITVEGAGVGADGIQFNTGGSLTVANCVIRHAAATGIRFVTAATSALFVSNTVVSDNAADGIQLSPTGSGTVTAVLNHVETNNNNQRGIVVNGASSTGTVNVTLSDSVTSRNQIGIETFSASGKALTTLAVFHSVTANNTSQGIIVSGITAQVFLAQSEVTGNAFGWQASGSGSLYSYQDNYINGNASGENPPTTIAKK